MVMGEAAEGADLVVIGGGPGGYTAALHAAGLGRAVTLIERNRLGGVCLQVGCIPSKFLIETAQAYDTAYRLLPAGIDPPLLELGEWQDRRARLVGGLESGIAGQLDDAGVRTVFGQARFTGRSRLAVHQTDGTTAFFEFRHAVIAVGSRPASLPALPVDHDRVIDSTGALGLTALPKRLAVVGAGSVGVELATAFAKLGGEVTLLEREDRILPELPAFLVRPVARRLDELGVSLEVGCSDLELDDEGLRGCAGGEELAVPCDKVLVAVGRHRNTDQLGLEAARIPLAHHGGIAVGPDRIVPGAAIAAIGDVTDGPMLAHKALAEAVVAVEALSGRRVAFEPAALPLVVFSDPEVASAGHTVESARAAGIAATGVSLPHGALGRAATMGSGNGFTHLVVEDERDVVIGVHLVGPHASELIGEGVLAIELAAAPGDLAASIHAHPTLSEGLQEAARRAARRPLPA